jgi:hypothetical protein
LYWNIYLAHSTKTSSDTEFSTLLCIATMFWQSHGAELMV